MPEQIYSFFTSITPIITAIIGIGGAKYVVNRWQTRKDISEIRKDVLRNYITSFKNHVNLMDKFVAELIMSYARFDCSPTMNEQKLSKLLPWGYTYGHLKRYSKTIEFDNLRNWEGKIITKGDIQGKFTELDKHTECYIDFQIVPLKKFGLEYVELQKQFYKSRPAVMEFKTLVHQYYVDSEKILENFSGMWEYMMACYILLNRIMSTGSRDEFLSTTKRYNESSYLLFDILRWVEKRLVDEKIEIDKNSWCNKLKRLLRTGNNLNLKSQIGEDSDLTNWRSLY
jgi:hypothetical protein